MVPLEAFLSEKPVLTTTDAGGPLEVVSDGSTGLVVTPDAEEIARALGWLRDHRDEAASTDAPATRSRARSRGIARSAGCSREARLLLADASGALGHRGLQRAPPARRCASGSTSRS